MNAPRAVLAPELVTERAWQAWVIDLARLCGWRCFHPFDSRRSEPGWPDLVLARPATAEILFVELKSERGKVTAEQGWWLAALETCGCTVHVWRPSHAEQVITALRRPVKPSCRPSPAKMEENPSRA